MGTSLTTPLLRFRVVCQRHQELFLAHAVRAGCCDPEELERVRLGLLVWLSYRYPLLVLESFSQGQCLGCTINEAQLDVKPIHDAVRQIVQERCRLHALRG